MIFISAATEFKEKFLECAKSNESTNNTKNEDKLAEDLSALKVKDEKDSKEEESPKENGDAESSEKESDSTTETPKLTTETTDETTSTKD